MTCSPAVSPGLDDHRQLGAPILIERLERLLGRVRVDRGVDRLDMFHDLVVLPAGDVCEAGADQVHDACLHDRFGEHGLITLGEPFEAVHAADHDVSDAALPELGQDPHQNLAPTLVWNHIPSTPRDPSIPTPSATGRRPRPRR
jgi:hypothetical protein